LAVTFFVRGVADGAIVAALGRSGDNSPGDAAFSANKLPAAWLRTLSAESASRLG
jgi:hypothetical protein